MFATLFSSVYLIENVNFDSKLFDIPKFDLTNKVYFSMDDVLEGLSALKDDCRSVGPNGLWWIFILNKIDYQIFSLHLFRQSLDDGILSYQYLNFKALLHPFLR